MEILWQASSLEWDTESFGFGVARVTPAASGMGLKDVLASLRDQRIRLVYVNFTKRSPETENTLISCGGLLVDEKVTYLKQIQTKPVFGPLPHGVQQSQFDPRSFQEFEKLAIQSGHRSRFFVDPSFPKEAAIALYSSWIRNSLNGISAKVVLAKSSEGRIQGMITLSEQDRSAQIGLFAVDEAYRGKGYGTLLLRASDLIALTWGCNRIRVVTQKTNESACAIYERTGFSVDKIEFIYHVWLDARVDSLSL